jgi:hypothetical protein
MARTYFRRCFTLITRRSAATTPSRSASRQHGRVGLFVLQARRISAGLRQDPGMESRGFSDRGARPLRLMPHPKEHARRRSNEPCDAGLALQGWFAPDLTNDPRRGLGSWSVDEIATYLKTGHNKTTAATGLMAETISRSTSRMSDADLRAIAVYLKDRPGDPANTGQNQQAASPAPDPSVMKIGQQIYADILRLVLR